jgi:hypothetical protein
MMMMKKEEEEVVVSCLESSIECIPFNYAYTFAYFFMHEWWRWSHKR